MYSIGQLLNIKCTCTTNSLYIFINSLLHTNILIESNKCLYFVCVFYL